MTDLQIKSWILLSTALASQSGPANYNGISEIADGINHAIPNHKELQDSLKWLISKGIVVKLGRNYSLTDLGRELIGVAESETNVIQEIWKNLEKRISKFEI